MHLNTLQGTFCLIFLLYFASTYKARIRCGKESLITKKRENLMEYINKIELLGKVGTVRSNIVNDNRVVNFSLVTDFLYKTREGNPVSEATWLNIVAWEGKEIKDADKIEKGATVHVHGRIRSSRFEGSDGTEKQVYEVLANKLQVIDKGSDNQL